MPLSLSAAEPPPPPTTAELAAELRTAVKDGHAPRIDELLATNGVAAIACQTEPPLLHLAATNGR